MNHRFSSLALASLLTAGLLTGCGSSTPPSTPSPEPSTPVVSDTPAPLPSESLLPSETPAPEGTPSAAPEESSAPSAAPSSKPTAKPSAQPSAKPTAKPTATPTPAPAASAVDDVWNEIAKNGDLPSLSDVDAATLEAVYGISSDDLVDYVCKMPLINVKATEYFIAEVKDGKMDSVKASLEARQDALDQQWSQYLPDQYELVQNYQLVTNGNYVLFVVSEYADEAVSAFNTYTK